MKLRKQLNKAASINNLNSQIYSNMCRGMVKSGQTWTQPSSGSPFDRLLQNWGIPFGRVSQAFWPLVSMKPKHLSAHQVTILRAPNIPEQFHSSSNRKRPKNPAPSWWNKTPQNWSHNLSINRDCCRFPSFSAYLKNGSNSFSFSSDSIQYLTFLYRCPPISVASPDSGPTAAERAEKIKKNVDDVSPGSCAMFIAPSQWYIVVNEGL